MSYERIGPTELISRAGYSDTGAIGPTELVARPGYMDTGYSLDWLGPDPDDPNETPIFDARGNLGKPPASSTPVKITGGSGSEGDSWWSKFGQGMLSFLTPKEQQQQRPPTHTSATPGIGGMPPWLPIVGIAVAAGAVYFLMKDKKKG